MSRFNATVEEDDDPPMVDPTALFPASSSSLMNPQDIFNQLSSGGGQNPFQSGVSPSQVAANVHNLFNGRGSAVSGAADSSIKEDVSHWIRLYPVYFDATRSRGEGRRVHKHNGVQSPLASVIAEAVMRLGLPVKMNPTCTHPKDWANPGMVLTNLPDGGRVKNKHHLFILVSDFLKSHPTTPSNSTDFARMAGMPFDLSKAPEPAGVPRGWKVGKVLPVHSAAIAEGISDDMMQEMMAGMSSMARGAAGGGAGGGGMPAGLEGLASMFGGGGGGAPGGMPMLPGLGGGSTGGAPSAPKKKIIRKRG